MLKLVAGLTMVVVLALAVAFVPLRGATLLERWALAPSTGEFVARTWRDAKIAVGLEKEKRPQRAQAPRPAQRPPQRTPADRKPTERHSDSDRAALDRIVAEHARP